MGVEKTSWRWISIWTFGFFQSCWMPTFPVHWVVIAIVQEWIDTGWTRRYGWYYYHRTGQVSRGPEGTHAGSTDIYRRLVKGCECYSTSLYKTTNGINFPTWNRLDMSWYKKTMSGVIRLWVDTHLLIQQITDLLLALQLLSHTFWSYITRGFPYKNTIPLPLQM